MIQISLQVITGDTRNFSEKGISTMNFLLTKVQHDYEPKIHDCLFIFKEIDKKDE